MDDLTYKQQVLDAKSLKSADTFCVKPLTHLYVSTTGQYGLCCKSNDSYKANANTTTVDDWWNSNYVKRIREDMANGIRVPECQFCWKMEDNGITNMSMRQKSNQEYVVNKDNYKKFLGPERRILDLEIQHTNLCNLKCLMCYQGASSQIGAEDIRLGIAYDRTLYNWPLERVDELLASGLHVLNIRGGEPLINDELYKLVETCYNKGYLDKTTLHITTNCTRIEKWYDLLTDIPNVRIMASVDGTGGVYNYIRFNSDWEVVQENMLMLSKISNLTAHSVAQNLNILNIHKLINWTVTNNISYDATAIEHPSYYRITNFPQKLLDQAYENINTCEVKNKITQRSKEDLLNYLKHQKSDMSEWNKFWEEILKRQSIRKNNILDVIPELTNHL